MAGERRKYTVSWVDGAASLGKTEWNELAAQCSSPFMEWGWLSSLEVSGSIAPEYGWRPRYVTVREDGRLIGAAPLYVRTGSEGEFVFDYVWADAAAQFGVQYFPKLVGMSPATPVPAFRFLTDRSKNSARIEEILFNAVSRYCENHHIPTCSFNYTDPSWDAPLGYGFLAWKHHGFLWENTGFTSFEDYLSVFTKNQRRNVRRERASMEEQGISIRVINGADAPDSYFSLMYRYYEKTNMQFGPWAAKFLNREFFSELRDRFRERIVFTAAFRNGNVDGSEPIALSFLVRKGKSLYGRFWGSDSFYENLYFNVCYYAPIEWCIHEGIATFDPGIGANLKTRRGFRSVSSVSMHKFQDPVMQRIFGAYIDRINSGEQEEIDELNRALPFKKSILEAIIGPASEEYPDDGR